jgi:single-stranded DNA-binding protein
MVNNVTIMGRVNSILKLKYTEYGMPYLPFKIALKQYKPEYVKLNKKGFRSVIRLCVFDEVALRCYKVLKKGSVVAVEGYLDNMHFYNKEDKLVNDLTVFVKNIQVIDGVKMEDGTVAVKFGAIEDQQWR